MTTNPMLATFRALVGGAPRLLLLTALDMVCAAAAARVFMPQLASAGAEAAAGWALGALGDALLFSGLLMLLILRSRLRGARLVAWLVVVLFLVRIAQPQIETLVFEAARARLPPGVFIALWPMGLAHLAVFVPLAVMVLGRWRGAPEPLAFELEMTPGEWGAKLAACAVLHVAVYFLFGHYIAWRIPEVRAFYGGPAELDGFWVGVRDAFQKMPWLPFFQLERGLFWALLAIPLVRMTRGSAREAALSVSLTFAIALSSQLLIPGPHMPRAVRMGHFVEILVSGLLYGWLVARILLVKRLVIPSVPPPVRAARMRAMWIMVAGPYATGVSDPEVRAKNLRAMNLVAVEIFRRGHVPIIGVNLALPVIQAAGESSYDEIMMPLSLALADRCDAVLRVGGASAGADREVERIRARGGAVYTTVAEVPGGDGPTGTGPG